VAGDKPCTVRLTVEYTGSFGHLTCTDLTKDSHPRVRTGRPYRGSPSQSTLDLTAFLEMSFLDNPTWLLDCSAACLL